MSEPEPEWRDFTAVERAMARRMQRAADVPIATSHVLLDVEPALALVKELRAEHPELTFTTLVVAAVAKGLVQHPDVAAVVDYEQMRRYLPEDPGIGVAVDSPRGLVVPVVPGATRASFGGIVSEVKRVVERARSGDRSMDQFTGGHFSITNIAAGGVHGGVPIMNVPQIAILGVGTARETPVVRDGEIVVGRVAQFTIALDHRALDGMTAAAFLTTVCDLLAEPRQLAD